MKDFQRYLNNNISNKEHIQEVINYINDQMGLFQNIQQNIVSHNNKDFFVNLMINYIDNKYKNLKNDLFEKDWEMLIRIHYSGDFYNEEYFDKWVQITDYFANSDYGNLYFMAYTKEIKTIEKYLQSKQRNLDNLNMKILFSVMENSTPQNNTSINELNVYNNLKKLSNKLSKYIVYANKASVPNNLFKCNLYAGGKCSDCLKCYKPCFNNDIGAVVHK